MKKLTLLIFLALNVLCNAEELKVETLKVKRIDYENGNMVATVFRVVCINGYKWLQYDGMHGSISQMFESNINGLAKQIKCEN